MPRDATPTPEGGPDRGRRAPDRGSGGEQASGAGGEQASGAGGEQASGVGAARATGPGGEQASGVGAEQATGPGQIDTPHFPRMRGKRGTSTGSRALGWWTLLLVAVSVVATIGLPLFGVGSFHASDVLQAYPPWRADAPAGFRVDNANVSDTVDATIPMRAAWRRRILDGDLPLWESYAAGGAPLSAIPNASTLSPLNVPYLVAPLWWAPALSKLLELLVAAGFTFLLARRWGLGRLAAGTAALIYMNSGFQVVWTNWPQSHVGALVPALFWAVDRGIAARRAWALWPIPVVAATMWFEGFPAVTLWAHAAVGVYALVRLVPAGWAGAVRRRGRAGARQVAAHARRGAAGVGRSLAQRWWRLVAVAVAMAVGAGVAALQLAPFAFRLSDLDLSYRSGKQIGALQWRSVITLLVPHAFGTPEDHVYYGIRHIVEIQSFVGVGTLVLVVAAAVWAARSRVSRRVLAFLWTAAAVSVVLIYVGGPLLSAIQAMPIVGANAIGRMRSLLGLFLAVLAGVGLQALVDTTTDRRRSWWLLGILTVVVGGAGATLWSVGRTAAKAGYPGYFRSSLVMPAVMLGLVTGLAVLMARRGVRPEAAPGRGRRLAIAVVPLLVAVEMVTFARPFFPRIPVDEFYPVTPAHEFVEARLGHDRIAAGDFAMYPGTTVLYGIRSVTAHTLTTKPYAELLQAVDWWVFLHNRTLPVIRPREVAAASPVLDRMGARFFVSPPEAPVFGREDFVAPDAGPQRVPAGASLNTPIDPGPLRGVRLRLHEPSNPPTTTFLRVDVLDADGRVVASGRRRILPRTPAGDFDVAVMPSGGSWPAGRPWRGALDRAGHPGDRGLPRRPRHGAPRRGGAARGAPHRRRARGRLHARRGHLPARARAAADPLGLPRRDGDQPTAARAPADAGRPRRHGAARRPRRGRRRRGRPRR